MYYQIIKICAIGCNLRLMTIEIIIDLPEQTKQRYTIRISDNLYKLLKKHGIPTSQKLRYEKQKNTTNK